MNNRVLKTFIWLPFCLLCSCVTDSPSDKRVQEIKKLLTANDNIRQERNDLGLGPDKLSEYGFFETPMKKLIPVGDVIPYDLNTPLFSDYAHKARFIRFPEGAKARYNQQEVLDFPIGTILIKNF